MRQFISAVTLAALLGSGATIWPVSGRAQNEGGLDTDRLRDAIAAQQSLPDSEDPVPALAEPLDAEALDDLVAPIALYPDALLAQVLVAATYPLQIVKAQNLIAASPEMTDEELSDAVAAQDWDPSVLVLMSGFPSVVTRMADDLEATERLGIAMTEQDDDVLAAVQRMRARAEDTGYLTSNAAQSVRTDGDQIYIEPADPDVVYVPTYDPNAAFVTRSTAAPYVAPAQGGFSGQDALVTGAVAFGTALLVDQLFGNSDDDDNQDGWDDYWRRPRPIDWSEREFYPRPRGQWSGRNDAWSGERDRYWDHDGRRWRRADVEAARRYQQERREALYWLTRRDQQADARARRDWRDDVRQAVERDRRLSAQRAAIVREQREAQRERRAVIEQREAARERRAVVEQREAARERRDAIEQRDALRERRAVIERRDAQRAMVARRQAAEAARERAEAAARGDEKLAAARRAEQAKAAARAERIEQDARKENAEAVARAEKARDATREREAKAAAQSEKARAAEQAEKAKVAERAEKAKAAERAKAAQIADRAKAAQAAARADKEKSEARAKEARAREVQAARAKEAQAAARVERARAEARAEEAARAARRERREAEARNEQRATAARASAQDEQRDNARPRRAEQQETQPRQKAANKNCRPGTDARNCKPRQ